MKKAKPHASVIQTNDHARPSRAVTTCALRWKTPRSRARKNRMRAANASQTSTTNLLVAVSLCASSRLDTPGAGVLRVDDGIPPPLRVATPYLLLAYDTAASGAILGGAFPTSMRTLPHLLENNRAWAQRITSATPTSFSRSRRSSRRTICGSAVLTAGCRPTKSSASCQASSSFIATWRTSSFTPISTACRCCNMRSTC